MDLRIGKFPITIRLMVVVVFMLATLLTATVALRLQIHFGNGLAKSAATDLYTAAANSIAQQLSNDLKQTSAVIRLAAANALLADENAESQQLELFAEVLTLYPGVYGIFVGRPDGSLLQLINLNASAIAREGLRATPEDRWVAVRVEQVNGERRRTLSYLDAGLRERVSRSEASNYDARERVWYLRAIASRETEISEPYLFAQLNAPGQTTSRVVAGTATVVGIDRTLASMSEYLQRQDIASLGEVYLYSRNGEVIASSGENSRHSLAIPPPDVTLSGQERAYIASLPPLVVSNELDWPPVDYAVQGEPRGLAVDMVRMVAASTGLQISFVNGPSWRELVELFQAGSIDILNATAGDPDWGLATASYESLPYAVVTRNGEQPLRSLNELAGRPVAIPEGWSVAAWVRQHYPDINIVPTAGTLDAMNQVLDGSVDAALDNLAILQYVQTRFFLPPLQYHREIDFAPGDLPNTLHMMVAPDRPELLAILNKAIAAIGPAQREALEARWLNMASEEESSQAIGLPHESLVKAAANPDLQRDLLEVRYRDTDYFTYAAPVLNQDGNDWLLGMLVPRSAVTGDMLDRVQRSIFITAAFLLLLLPMSWYFAGPIVRPVRQLAKETDKIRRREYDAVQRIDSPILEIDQLSRSMVAMVQAIQAHELSQRELMDAFIRLIAQAIDDKSPYTGGHCERVPELALMLAEKADRSSLPAFSEFRLETEDQWREFRIAAWLHDCGKITTPEHVVDKGSKLEAIYNRLHEVRMRFELLWRDAEIDYLRRVAEDPAREPQLRAGRDATRQGLQEDFAFVAACNVGGEYLEPEGVERLNRIAAISWTRHFSNRIGLSPVEELQLPETPETLPAREPLLADRPEHLIPHDRATDYPPEHGIDMDIPELRANLGELHNLAVSRGTLTAEDRFRIKEHMISTIKMLESLPFPPELKRVPRYASTHHETLRGDGYPRRLSAAELSVPERLLAVADVFEALTASDRPYKKGKTVSEAVTILHRMVEEDHLDRDSFELFLREGVYLDYARCFLAAEQIDRIDVERYLSTVRSSGA